MVMLRVSGRAGKQSIISSGLLLLSQCHPFVRLAPFNNLDFSLTSPGTNVQAGKWHEVYVSQISAFQDPFGFFITHLMMPSCLCRAVCLEGSHAVLI